MALVAVGVRRLGDASAPDLGERGPCRLPANVAPQRGVVVDAAATDALREQLRGAREDELPFFDRGPGYAALAEGRTSAEVDWL